jgi:hypothetical protein
MCVGVDQCDFGMPMGAFGYSGINADHAHKKLERPPNAGIGAGQSSQSSPADERRYKALALCTIGG